MVLAFVWHMADWKKFGVRHRPSLAWHHAARQRQIGYASGLSMGIENTAFNMLILFAGMIGATVVAAYSITFNIFALCFMIGLGFGSATAVRVGNAYGAKNFHLVARYSWIGLGTQMSFLFVLVSCFYVFAPFLVGAYTQDAEVIALAILLLKYALLALYLMPRASSDGAVFAGAPRYLGGFVDTFCQLRPGDDTDGISCYFLLGARANRHD